VSAHSSEYQALLRSSRWQAMRRDRLVERGWKCERCRSLAYDLQLHHRHYDTLGDERDEDLVLLCPPCHRRADAERMREREAEQWRRRVDGWASRVYGDNWAEVCDVAQIEDEFTDWLSLREESDWA
jgi:5-methylcytosine-specific restriction endonuclease McrA